jgi:hypothetical protein
MLGLKFNGYYFRPQALAFFTYFEHFAVGNELLDVQPAPEIEPCISG